MWNQALCSRAIAAISTNGSIAPVLTVPAEATMAIGDNFNDIEMLEFAGTSVVMGNADPRLIEREEFYNTVSNDECGVAAAIEVHILNSGEKLRGQ